MRVDSWARTIAYVAPVSSSTSRASGLSKRNISAATGVSASTAPASRAAGAEKWRRTVAWTRPTVATPIRACGTSRLQLLIPKIRAESAITHSEAGGLSTVIALPASREPKKNAVQDSLPACTALA